MLAQVSDNDEISHQTSAPITERRLQDGDSLNEVDYRTCISGGGGWHISWPIFSQKYPLLILQTDASQSHSLELGLSESERKQHSLGGHSEEVKDY